MKTTRAQKIAAQLIARPCFIPVFISTWTEKKKYVVSWELSSDDISYAVVLRPYNGKGSTALSHGMIDYAYDMGGEMFRAAVQFAREIEAAIPKA